MRCFSVAERKKNLGGGFWIRAVTGYSLLADVFLFFFPTAVGIVLKFLFPFWILGRGVRGECPKSKTPYFFTFKLTTMACADFLILWITSI